MSFKEKEGEEGKREKKKESSFVKKSESVCIWMAIEIDKNNKQSLNSIHHSIFIVWWSLYRQVKKLLE